MGKYTLVKLVLQKKQKLNWRKSIVDLMKLLDLDSSGAARKRLADELHYQGDRKDSAKMTILAAQAGHDEARPKWRKGSRRFQAIKSEAWCFKAG